MCATPIPAAIVSKQRLDFNQPIINKNDRTYYPLRELFEAVGATVSWDGVTRTAMGTLGSRTVSFMIDANTYRVNGQTMKMAEGVTAFVQDGKTYVPIRDAAEGLGFSVNWDGATNTIVIK